MDYKEMALNLAIASYASGGYFKPATGVQIVERAKQFETYLKTD